MGHSIAAKYAARPAARFVRPSSRSRERRLGLGARTSFLPVGGLQTQLRGPVAGPFERLRSGWRGPRPIRSHLPDRRVRPLVTMHWARSGLTGAGRRPSAAAAPWHA